MWSFQYARCPVLRSLPEWKKEQKREDGPALARDKDIIRSCDPEVIEIDQCCPSASTMSLYVFVVHCGRISHGDLFLQPSGKKDGRRID